MAETDVENILSDIRRRVRADFRAHTTQVAIREPTSREPPSEVPAQQNAGRLADLQGKLAVTEGTWNGFPALTSKRSGLLAKVELSIKQKVKRFTHWYTWAQIHFNASVSEALRDICATQALAKSEVDSRLHALNSRLASIEDRLTAFVDRQAEHQGIEARGFRKEVAHVRNIIDDRIANLREEQRVVFNQLSLDIKETEARVNRMSGQ